MEKMEGMPLEETVHPTTQAAQTKPAATTGSTPPAKQQSSGAAPQISTKNLESGDIILFNRKCLAMRSLQGMLICGGAKLLSPWDHVGIIYRPSQRSREQRGQSELMVVEANFNGVTVRDFHQRVERSASHEIVIRQLEDLPPWLDRSSEEFRQRFEDFVLQHEGLPYKSSPAHFLSCFANAPQVRDRERVTAWIRQRKELLSALEKELDEIIAASPQKSVDQSTNTISSEAEVDKLDSVTDFVRRALEAEKHNHEKISSLLISKVGLPLSDDGNPPIASNSSNNSRFGLQWPAFIRRAFEGRNNAGLDGDGLFCSELCATGLQNVGLVASYPRATRYGPLDFSTNPSKSIALQHGARYGEEKPIKLKSSRLSGATLFQVVTRRTSSPPHTTVEATPPPSSSDSLSPKKPLRPLTRPKYADELSHLLLKSYSACSLRAAHQSFVEMQDIYRLLDLPHMNATPEQSALTRKLLSAALLDSEAPEGRQVPASACAVSTSSTVSSSRFATLMAALLLHCDSQEEAALRVAFLVACPSGSRTVSCDQITHSLQQLHSSFAMATHRRSKPYSLNDFVRQWRSGAVVLSAPFVEAVGALSDHARYTAHNNNARSNTSAGSSAHSFDLSVLRYSTVRDIITPSEVLLSGLPRNVLLVGGSSCVMLFATAPIELWELSRQLHCHRGAPWATRTLLRLARAPVVRCASATALHATMVWAAHRWGMDASAEVHPYTYIMLAGGAGGLLATWLSHPLEVARVQQAYEAIRAPANTVRPLRHHIAALWRRGGLRALWSGGLLSSLCFWPYAGVHWILYYEGLAPFLFPATPSALTNPRQFADSLADRLRGMSHIASATSTTSSNLLNEADSPVVPLKPLLLFGTLCGAAHIAAAFPMEVLARRKMVKSWKPANWDTLSMRARMMPLCKAFACRMGVRAVPSMALSLGAFCVLAAATTSRPPLDHGASERTAR